jgi:hypothetical protein
MQEFGKNSSGEVYRLFGWGKQSEYDLESYINERITKQYSDNPDEGRYIIIRELDSALEKIGSPDDETLLYWLMGYNSNPYRATMDSIEEDFPFFRNPKVRNEHNSFLTRLRYEGVYKRYFGMHFEDHYMLLKMITMNSVMCVHDAKTASVYDGNYTTNGQANNPIYFFAKQKLLIDFVERQNRTIEELRDLYQFFLIGDESPSLPARYTLFIVLIISSVGYLIYNTNIIKNILQ